ncbi:hypothetical protein C2E23DRAFT_19400 [Lenzites betulinus]|nr:hypothetical protein C2E23DRAFT_19400 [Lenzites betulinus]
MSQGSANSTDSVGEFVNGVSPVDAEGQVVCHHRVPAKRLTSRTSANPDRAFFVCPNEAEGCGFWMWADSPMLRFLLESKKRAGVAAAPTPVTPQRPSQATRALFSRSPTIAAASLRKRQRTPSPTPSSSAATTSVGAVKHRRVDGAVSNSVRSANPTPSARPPQRSGLIRQTATPEERKAARMRSIEDAILSIQATSRDLSPATSRDVDCHVEEVTQFSPRQGLSDAPHHTTPSSLSQNKQNPRMFPRYTQGAQSDAGTNIDSEIELAEMEDMESRAVRASSAEDDGSVIEEFSTPSPTRSAIGSQVSATAEEGAGLSRAYPHRMPAMPQASEAERIAWSSIPPQTPGRGGSSGTYAPGEKEGESNPSMLLTPPGSSQPRRLSEAGAGPSTLQRGRSLLQEMLLSPTASMDSGPGSSNSASTNQRWQMVQDDPENPFRASAVARASATPAPTAMSVADGVSGVMPAGALSADSIASHLAALQGVPEYIAKLERREKAAQKSAEIKGRKIVQLEQEVQRLRNEKRALEETVAALQVRR